uniref:NADH-ubiquinone oxidoreductase chain 6 n=1 Tax=Maja crispata TaxID=471962 RepID=A0A343E787_9EUCA|nr:NADH dehydrogenase subunit 6 [Maja crispata]ASF62435.1 NADH dehydrogenase subunit 6 [Maja crispata]
MNLSITPLLFILSLLFTQLHHPLAMGLILLFQTILIAINLGIYTYSFWFSYILFMIFLGGMLVLFIYVSSLASNEIFSFSASSFMVILTLSLILFFLFMFLDPLMTSSNSNLPQVSMNLSFSSTPLTIMWIYGSSIMYFTLFIILYLLLTLIVIVKITNLFKGPLRLTN